MITADIYNSVGDLTYTVSIHAEYYLSIILGAITALTFFLMIKR